VAANGDDGMTTLSLKQYCFDELILTETHIQAIGAVGVTERLSCGTLKSGAAKFLEQGHLPMYSS
jgi:hypothetical protein